MKILKSLLTISSLMVVSSCAYLISGKTTDINLLAQDPEAKFEVEINQNGAVKTAQVPGIITLPRSESDVIIKVKENSCYKTSQTVVPSNYNLIAFLDLLGTWSSTTSTTVDVTSNAAWTYDKTVYVNAPEKKGCKK